MTLVPQAQSIAEGRKDVKDTARPFHFPGAGHLASSSAVPLAAQNVYAL